LVYFLCQLPGFSGYSKLGIFRQSPRESLEGKKGKGLNEQLTMKRETNKSEQ
jgi:hypothetical protein